MDWMPKLTGNDEKRDTLKIWTSGRNFQKKVSCVDYSDSEDEDNMIVFTEWVKIKKTVFCPFAREDQDLPVPYHL
jgi:hypothetical protein